MAKKKLLSEAQVRKFMGLANIDAGMSSNFISENWGSKEDEYKRHDVDGVEKKAGDKDGHYKDYEMDEAKIVAEVTRRVAKRLNEAVRAQKKANKLLGK